jgi:hypothetical protein
MNTSPKSRPLPRSLEIATRAKNWNVPLDTKDLTTRLETEGVTDEVARTGYGYATTWDMAEDWMPRLIAIAPPAQIAELKAGSWRDYATGISFALPLLASILALAVFHVSLWGGELSGDDATAVGLGTLLSFLLTGGWIQVMTRRGLFFLGTKQFRRAEQSTWHWMRTGTGALAVSVSVLLLTSAYWEWLPLEASLTSASFAAGLGFLWLATGTLHIHERGLMVVWVTLGGIALVSLLHQGLQMPLLVSQLTGIVVSALASLAIASRLFRQQLERSPVVAFPPSFLRDAYGLWPYFCYGILYYVLLFSDRFLAWTAATYATPLLVEFRGGYESALNVGLLAFVFQVGWVHYAVAAFYRQISLAETRHSIDSLPAFRDSMRQYYWTRLGWFAPISIGVAALSFGAAFAGGYLSGGAALVVALGSLIGFPFLVIGLWNVSLLFGLNCAPKTVAAAALGAAVNIAAGYIASRVGPYHFAVVGFAMGSIVFAAVSGAYCLRALRRLDYFHFAA